MFPRLNLSASRAEARSEVIANGSVRIPGVALMARHECSYLAMGSTLFDSNTLANCWRCGADIYRLMPTPIAVLRAGADLLVLVR